jgi:hypothetical protein
VHSAAGGWHQRVIEERGQIDQAKKTKAVQYIATCTPPVSISAAQLAQKVSIAIGVGQSSTLFSKAVMRSLSALSQ